MNIFFEKEKENFRHHSVIELNLRKLPNEMKQELALHILGRAFVSLRTASETMERGTSETDPSFYHTLVWFLSDVLHNLPLHINGEIEKMTFYLAEFLVFSKSFVEITNKPWCHRLENCFKWIGEIQHSFSYLYTEE